MRILLLTTKTPHHLYFAKLISSNFNLVSTILEMKSVIPKFTVDHEFEAERDEYENKILLEEKNINFDIFSETKAYDNVNDEICVDYIKSTYPDVIISFGTGIIRDQIINLFPERIINLHGGDPEYYRGLDSHLWAIYHKQFDKLDVTLHHVNETLDDGNLINKGKVKLRKESKIHTLRSETTKVCVELVIDSLLNFKEKGIFDSIPQNRIGRYYSFMPSVLKEVCINNFNNYVREL